MKYLIPIYIILTLILSLVLNTKNFILQFFNIHLIIIQITLIFLVLYNVLIGYFGNILKRYHPPQISLPKNRFAILVAAHNEELVISSIIKSLHTQAYPKELYDIYVICDNCTDSTAKVVVENNAIALERFDNDKRGKGFALEWTFRELWKKEETGISYDAVIIFDADNIVSPKFLAHMDTKLQQGYEIVQGYIDTKNPSDSWVTKSYSFQYWSTNRVYQLARHQLGLSAQLGGTGVAIKTSVIKEMGWGSTCLTEDLEFTQQYLIKTGKPIAWSHEAKTYDEKPLKIGSSMNQRVRWMSGRFDCAIRYSPKLLKNALEKKSFMPIDSMIYLLSPSRFILFAIFGIFVSIKLLNSFIFNSSIVNSLDIFNPITYLIVILLYFSLPIFGLIMEKKYSKIHWIFITYFFGFSWIPVTILGFIKRKNTSWSHTQHNVNINNNDLFKDEN